MGAADHGTCGFGPLQFSQIQHYSRPHTQLPAAVRKSMKENKIKLRSYLTLPPLRWQQAHLNRCQTWPWTGRGNGYCLTIGLFEFKWLRRDKEYPVHLHGWRNQQGNMLKHNKRISAQLDTRSLWEYIGGFINRKVASFCLQCLLDFSLTACPYLWQSLESITKVTSTYCLSAMATYLWF